MVVFLIFSKIASKLSRCFCSKNASVSAALPNDCRSLLKPPTVSKKSGLVTGFPNTLCCLLLIEIFFFIIFCGKSRLRSIVRLVQLFRLRFCSFCSLFDSRFANVEPFRDFSINISFRYPPQQLRILR